MATVAESMDQIVYVGIGVFILVLIMSLNFQGFASAQNNIQTTWCQNTKANACTLNAISGVAQNFSTYGGPLPNTYGGALQLAVFALVFIAIILAIVGALRGGGATGVSGGFLGR